MNNQINVLTERMISRRVSLGNNAAESRALLTEVITTFSAQNLPSALVYNNFSTERAAIKFAALISA